jgi:hypothetical protein
MGQPAPAKFAAPEVACIAGSAREPASGHVCSSAMRRMRWGWCGLLLAIAAMLVGPATASAAWSRPARIGALVENPFRISVASARQVTAVAHAAQGRDQFNSVVGEVWLDLRRGAKFLPREKVATTSRFLTQTTPAVATDGTVALGYTSTWIDPADPFGIDKFTLSFRVRSPAGTWSAEQQARIPAAQGFPLVGGMVATRSGFTAIWEAGTETGGLLVTARYARATGKWTFASESTEQLSSVAVGPDGSVGLLWIGNGRTAASGAPTVAGAPSCG